jgi:hypothetical protein
MVFVLCIMISHPRFAAKCETGRKGNKENIAFITLSISHVTFESFAKEMKKLKPLEKQDLPLGFT